MTKAIEWYTKAARNKHKLVLANRLYALHFKDDVYFHYARTEGHVGVFAYID